MTTCECCKKFGDDLLLQPAGYSLCLRCSNKIKLRLAAADVERYANASYSIDRAELLALKADKLLSLKAYVYFALRLDFPTGGISTKIELAEFCDRWQVSQFDFFSATAALGKKGILYLRTQSIELEVPSRADRLAQLEQNFERSS